MNQKPFVRGDVQREAGTPISPDFLILYHQIIPELKAPGFTSCQGYASFISMLHWEKGGRGEGEGKGGGRRGRREDATFVVLTLTVSSGDKA